MAMENIHLLYENIRHENTNLGQLCDDDEFNILNDASRLIKHCRKSLLFSSNEAWKNKQTENCFGVTMGFLAAQWYADLWVFTFYVL